MLNVPFVNPTDANAGLQLNKDITVENVTASAEGTAEADQIRVWVPANNGYRRFFRYAGATVDGVVYAPGWCDADDADWGYIEDSDDFADGIPLGAAMFYKAKKGEGKTMTGAGAIEKQDEVELPLTGNNFTMIGNPFPTPLQLNGDKFTVENVTASAEGTAEADQIRVWVPANNGYRRFFRYAGATVDGVVYAPGWCDADDADWGYIEDSDDFADGIPTGTAMFYKAKKGEGKSAVFTSPFVTK